MAQNKNIVVYGNGEFISMELPNYHSREQVLLDPITADLFSGTVLGIRTSSGNYAPWDPNASDGTQNMKGFLFARRALSTNPQRCVALVRDMDFNINKILFAGAVTPTAAQVTAMLAAAAQLRMIGRG